ncbi:hypothetical protein T484DRAFT_1775574 [Baffinella frigidus]|nr:hypothetical protein T484DRAFT_1775574 [Cryptophyta sp. CCMP2293]
MSNRRGGKRRRMYRSAFQSAARAAGRTFKRNMSAGDQKIPGNVGLEVGVGLAIGGACAYGLKSSLDKDIAPWAAHSEAAKPAPAKAPPAAPSAGDTAAMDKFLAWAEAQKAASPADAKDTADMKFYTFTELPPFTAKHKSLMAKHLTPELWARYQNVKSSKGIRCRART